MDVLIKPEILEEVHRVLTKVLEENGAGRIEIQKDTSLIKDLGFTSLMFVDLTGELEDAFKLKNFPMQRWIDEQMSSDSAQFTIQALVEQCQELILSDVK